DRFAEPGGDAQVRAQASARTLAQAHARIARWQPAAHARAYTGAVAACAAAYGQTGRAEDQPDVPAHPALTEARRFTLRGANGRGGRSGSDGRGFLAMVGVAGDQDPICQFPRDHFEAVRESL